MATFDEFLDEFYSVEKNRIVFMSDIKQAFEAGQASVNVLTANQLQSEIVRRIYKHYEETAIIVERLKNKGEHYDASCVEIDRDGQIKSYRQALGFIIDLIAGMEKEREEVSR